MTQQEIAYNGQEVINVSLSADSEALSEVVVTGYSSISRERATGSFVKVDSEELEKVYHADVTESLKTLSPGVLMTTTDVDGGEELVIQMRGKATLEGQSDPLIVIDGFPVETKLSSINPSDIESINLLQDAAAASIWGARAANGVIVVTTKRGKVGMKPQVEFSYNTKIYTKPDLDDFQIADYQTSVDAYTHLTETEVNPNLSSYKYGYNYNEVRNAIMEHHLNPDTFTEEMKNEVINKYSKYDVLGDYDRLMLQTGVSHDANFSIRGGSDFQDYFFSYNFKNDKSKYVGDKGSRHIITLNNNFRLAKNLELQTGVNLLFENKELNAAGLGWVFGSGHKVNMLDPFMDENGDPTRHLYTNSKGAYTYDELYAMGLKPAGQSLYADYLDNDNKRKRRNVRLNAALEYDILDGLSVKVSGLYEVNRNINRNLYNENSEQVYKTWNTYANFVTDVQGNKKIESDFPEGSILDRYTSTVSSYTGRALIDYNKTIGKHTINALAGTEFREVKTVNDQREDWGFDPQLNTYQLVDYKTMKSETGDVLNSYWGMSPNLNASEYRSRFASYFVNGAYTYDNKYTFTFSGRIDDGSMFGVDANKRRTPLWSVGGSWNISKEDFFNVPHVDHMKLRLTYGKNGIVNTNFSSFTTLKSEGYDLQTHEAIYSVKNKYNPDLKWEMTATTNFAIDFALFDHKLNGSVEVYKKKSTDVLADKKLSPFSGASSKMMNAGIIENKGWTVQLSANIGNEFVWTPGLNISHNSGKIVKAKPISGTPSNFIQETFYWGSFADGFATDAIYGYEFAGLNPEDGQPMVYNENGEVVKSWEPITSLDAIKQLGHKTPQTWGAFTNSFKYKNFSLHTVIGYKFGYHVKRPMFTSYDVSNGFMHESVKDVWKKPGDEKHTIIPGWSKVYNSNYYDYYQRSSAGYIKGDHIRLQDVSLTYDFKKDFIKGVKNLQLRAQVSNLGILWKATDLDVDPDYVPFSSATGISGSEGQQVTWRPGGRPQPVYTVGFKVNF